MSVELDARLALERHGFRFSHSLGQNFLLDERIISSIVRLANVRPGDSILEIGAGTGILTRAMADAGAHVLALELDRSLEPVLRDVVGDRARIVFQDALKCDLAALARDAFPTGAVRVVANLPYYITADALMKLTDETNDISDIVLMVQKEAALRVTARPGSKEYCALAATVKYYGQPEMLLDVPPSAFTPAPHVDSVLMHIARFQPHPYPAHDTALLRRVIACAFAMRRKTLANNLAASFAIPRERAQRMITELGWDTRVRGEALDVPDFVALCEQLAVHEEFC